MLGTFLNLVYLAEGVNALNLEPQNLVVCTTSGKLLEGSLPQPFICAVGMITATSRIVVRIKSWWNLQCSEQPVAQSKPSLGLYCVTFLLLFYNRGSWRCRNMLGAPQLGNDAARMETQNRWVPRYPSRGAILLPILHDDERRCLHCNENMNCYSNWTCLVRGFWMRKLSGIREKSTILLCKVSVGLCEGGAFPQRFSSEFIANLAHTRRCQKPRKTEGCTVSFLSSQLRLCSLRLKCAWETVWEVPGADGSSVPVDIQVAFPSTSSHYRQIYLCGHEWPSTLSSGHQDCGNVDLQIDKSAFLVLWAEV